MQTWQYGNLRSTSKVPRSISKEPPYLAVGKLLVGMPGVEVDHQVVFLVEGEAADEAAQPRLLLVLGLKSIDQ